MESSVIRKTELAGATSFRRLDAEFVSPHFRTRETALRRRPGDVAKSLVVSEAATYEEDSLRAEEAYIAIEAVDNDDGLVLADVLPKEELPSRSKYRVRQGDILVSNVRPNRGAVALASASEVDAIASSGFTLLRLRDEQKPRAEVTFAFLKSSHGRDQLVRRNRGSMYPAVVADDVLEIWVPRFTKKDEAQIRGEVVAGQKSHREFFQKHKKATEMLASLLAPFGLPPDPVGVGGTGVESAVVAASAMHRAKGAQRLDAEFFRSGYESFAAGVTARGPSFLLGKMFEINPGRALVLKEDVNSYFLKQGALTNVGVNWPAVLREPGRIPAGTWTVQDDDVLMACTAHETAYVARKVDVVRERPAEFVAEKVGVVPDVLILRPRKERPAHVSSAYVAAFLRHPAGRYQVQRCIRPLCQHE